MLDQTFSYGDLPRIGFLTVMEVVLSIDNALVLAMLARRLPKARQGAALNYGLVIAFIFRFIAIAVAQFIMRWSIVGLLGGIYLVYIAINHFFFEKPTEEKAADLANAPAHGWAKFWPTVAAIAFTDIAFAADSVLAAVGLVGPAPEGTPAGGIHPKLWVIVMGALLGIVALRFAASLFIKLLEMFPRFESAAYLLVVLIGLKLTLDWVGRAFGFERYIDFHHVTSPTFWVFWAAMVACFFAGFLPESTRNTQDESNSSTEPAEQS